MQDKGRRKGDRLSSFLQGELHNENGRGKRTGFDNGQHHGSRSSEYAQPVFQAEGVRQEKVDRKGDGNQEKQE